MRYAVVTPAGLTSVTSLNFCPGIALKHQLDFLQKKEVMLIKLSFLPESSVLKFV